jgi:2-polyprenyl-3-methyl-5-hydroxy-6-metoxy-1,4-benzoquinol methylase
MTTTKRAADLYALSTDPIFQSAEITLGPWTSHSLVHDPKHLAFVLSRYKFVAKMLQGRERVMEVGVGDGFGLPLVAASVAHVYAVDWDRRLLDGIARRLPHLANVTYIPADINSHAPEITVDAAYWVDVLEHLDPEREATVMDSLRSCLTPDGVLLTGTPNKTASAHASPQSEIAHINLKTMEELRALMQRHFKNVFMFGMNDEVLHTGFSPMCHYLWSLAVAPR